MLNNLKDNSKILKSQARILELPAVAFVETLMNNIKEAVVSSYSQNVYMIKVSEFYREIMQKGLLKEMRKINFESCSEDNCVERMKDYIYKQCTATQEHIKKKIREG